ncbi:hypothetical protein OIO90_006223 [Microbotryomycetes sp. JL221]|nr:hypothetical protein OIO90_006223 [Microbotryomycetes sp. JL221]
MTDPRDFQVIYNGQPGHLAIDEHIRIQQGLGDQATSALEFPTKSLALATFVPAAATSHRLRLIYFETSLDVSDDDDVPSVRTADVELDSSINSTTVAQHPQLSQCFVSQSQDQEQRSRPIHVIINDFAGKRDLASSFASRVVGPLLLLSGIIDGSNLRLHETQSAEDGVNIGKTIRRQGQQSTVIVLGGDGTVSEVLNGLLRDDDNKVSSMSPETDFVVVPLGTANAQYYHLFPPERDVSSPAQRRLQSLLSFVLRRQSLPLAFAVNEISTTSQDDSQPQPILTTVVTSAALHSALLFDAEALRSSMPGLERFKVAAQQNATRWFNGTLKLSTLLKDNCKQVRRYNSIEARFVDVDKQEVVLEGPFSYFVSALVSRFEPTFVVAPLRSPDHASSSTPNYERSETAQRSSDLASSMDIVVIRPLRDPETQQAVALANGNEEQLQKIRQGFAQKLWSVTAGMYDGGKHINARYEADGGEGSEIVEYYRCEKLKWIPGPDEDEKGRIVCFDGALREIGQGGSVTSHVTTSSESAAIRIWA